MSQAASYNTRAALRARRWWQCLSSLPLAASPLASRVFQVPTGHRPGPSPPYPHSCRRAADHLVGPSDHSAASVILRTTRAKSKPLARKTSTEKVGGVANIASGNDHTRSARAPLHFRLARPASSLARRHGLRVQSTSVSFNGEKGYLSAVDIVQLGVRSPTSSIRGP